METTERRTVTINDQTYKVVGHENGSKITVTVYDGDETSSTSKKTVMAECKEYKKKWLGLREREYESLPVVMQDALTEAVETIEDERLQREEIDNRMSNIKDTYSSEE